MTEDMTQDDVGEEDGTLSAAAEKIAALMAEEQDSPRAGAAEGEAAQAPAAEQPPEPNAAAASPQLQAAMQQAAMAAQQAAAERDRYAQALDTLLPRAQAAALQSEFPEVRSLTDLERLGQNDPARFNRFMFAQMRVQQAQDGHRALVAEAQQAQRTQQAQWAVQERQKLDEAIPELGQPEGPALVNRLRQFAAGQGYTAQDMARASARDFIMLHRAMRLADIEAAQSVARDKARTAPPVQQPGTRGQGGHDKFRGDLDRLQKSGRVDDAALVFQNLLSR